MENYDDHQIREEAWTSRTTERYTLRKQFHRVDGPAYIVHKFKKLYYHEYIIYGKTHRIDGPACICYDSDGSIQAESYYFDNKRIYMHPFIDSMREAVNKTKAFLNILKTITENKNSVAIILTNIFRNDIDPDVVNNLEMFF